MTGVQTCALPIYPLAGGIISVEKLSTSVPDGKTIGLLGDGLLNIIPSVNKNTKISLDDFTPLAGLVTINFLLVIHPSIPANNLQQLISVSNKYSNELDVSVGGSSFGPTRFIWEDLKLKSKLKVRPIPFKGANSAAIEAISGRVSASMLGIPVALPYIKTNRLRAIAVTKNTRSFLLPNVPTVEQSGIKDFNAYSYMGLFGPKNLPESIVAKYFNDLTILYKDQALKEKLENMGLEPSLMNQKQLIDLVKHKNEYYQGIIKRAQITLE